MAASDEAFQELLTRALNIAGDTSMRDKRRALSRALANALNDVGTKVDNEIAFTRMLDDLDPVHIRVLRIMVARPSILTTLPTGWTRQMIFRRFGSGTRGASSPPIPASKRRSTGRFRMLERHGLVWDRGPQLVPQPHGIRTNT